MRIAILSADAGLLQAFRRVFCGLPGAGTRREEAIEWVRVPMPDARLEQLVALLQPKKWSAAQVQMAMFPEIPLEAEGAARVLGKFFAVWEGVVFLGEREEDWKRFLEVERERERALLEEARARAERMAAKGVREEKERVNFLRELTERLDHEPPILEPERRAGAAAYGLWLAFPFWVLLRERELPDLQVLAEILELPAEERPSFAEAYGVPLDWWRVFLEGLPRRFGCIRFYTIVGREVRSWEVRRGATAREAAARIHTDMGERFIRAEVIPVEGFLEARSWEEATRRGLVRKEGPQYRVQDGDILTVHFQRA